MPQLNPEAGIPAIQLVQPETSRGKLLDLYLEVYKLHRLPSSHWENWPFCRRYPLSSYATHWRRKGLLMPKGSLVLKISTCPGAESPTGKEKGSLDKSLARVCKAHQKAMSNMVTLEEEIEKLYRMKVRSQPELRPRGRDHLRLEERRKKRCHQVSFTSKPTPS